MATCNIKDHLRDSYGINLSNAMVSQIVDQLSFLMYKWQTRTLERVYPMFYMDTIPFKVRKDSTVTHKCIRVQKDNDKPQGCSLSFFYFSAITTNLPFILPIINTSLSIAQGLE